MTRAALMQLRFDARRRIRRSDRKRLIGTMRAIRDSFDMIRDRLRAQYASAGIWIPKGGDR